MPKPFDYGDLGEAWADFDKEARLYFLKVLKNKAKKDKDIVQKAKKLKYRQYCVRFMYILSLLAPNEGDVANLDWAMLLANPPTVGEAYEALKELIRIRVIELGLEDIETVEDGKHPPQDGGDTTTETKFDFE